MQIFESFAMLRLGEAIALPGDVDSCPSTFVKLSHCEFGSISVIKVIEFECESLLIASELAVALQKRRHFEIASPSQVLRLIQDNLWIVHYHTPHCGRMLVCEKRSKRAS